MQVLQAFTIHGEFDVHKMKSAQNWTQGLQKPSLWHEYPFWQGWLAPQAILE